MIGSLVSLTENGDYGFLGIYKLEADAKYTTAATVVKEFMCVGYLSNYRSHIWIVIDELKVDNALFYVSYFHGVGHVLIDSRSLDVIV